MKKLGYEFAGNEGNEGRLNSMIVENGDCWVEYRNSTGRYYVIDFIMTYGMVMQHGADRVEILGWKVV